MIIRSKAPLRLGLAGGGSDVSPYSDLYGGLILNATVNMFVYCTIDVGLDDRIYFNAPDIEHTVQYDSALVLPMDGKLDILKGVYNRIIKDYDIKAPLSFTMTTYSDAPPGSGLGSSSTLVVAVVKAFVEWLNLPLGEYEIGHLAYEIERNDLGLTGGKQDQYAAAFGGFNFMEFHQDRVIVNPLRVKRWIVDELESSLILYYTGASRSSASIIDEQKRNTSSGNLVAIEAMHQIKQSSSDMKEAILKGDIPMLSRILAHAWDNKKKMASSISNDDIDSVFKVALEAGAYTGKVSGAGGGGFIMFLVNPVKKVQVVSALNALNGRVVLFQFSEGGCHGWKIYN
ncbi:GHMP family kinase ATP-binding protein [Mucilaginibacter glaciei]|uniref:Dehydrogenase n=1 Tax=Mucilaginibacter glaciei TaxID=2772109 RepID=A0A926NNX1_9SPHI|nr:dehydrogenase [Mucilaginibacter glaciei]MBD1394641.1 dehydrogenase [Mucilaginibacter glaciei]